MTQNETEGGVKLRERVRRLEMVGEDTHGARHGAAFLAALVAFGGGGGAEMPMPGRPVVQPLATAKKGRAATAALLAALRAWGDG